MIPPTAIEPNALQSPHESLERQLHFLLDSAGISPVSDLGWIRVTGADRVRWLNGMVTNSIQDLKPGEGNYSFALNAQGQIQGDLNTFATADDSLLLQTAKDRVPAMVAMFDRFIIMDDVELQDLSERRFGIAIIGPSAAELLQQIGLTPPSPTTPSVLSLVTHPSKLGSVIDVIVGHSPLVPRFELWADESTRDAVLAELLQRTSTCGGGLVDSAALESLRLLEGTPRFGTDIHEKILAQETAQTRALHFSKGCYLGQEIVERIRSRGNVHRAITTFRLEGPLPPVGTPVVAEGKSIAELTSVATIPLASGPLQLGIGLARREAVERGTGLSYAANETQGAAIPMPTPFQPPR